MAATNLPIEQVMGKLKIDHCMKPIQDVNGSPSAATGSLGESEIDYEPPVVPYSPNNYYGYSYYYPGFESPEVFSGVMDNQGYYMNGGDGSEVQYPVMVADDGSLVCFMPGYQPGYDPYTSYLPMATTGADGHYVAQQPYPLSSVFSPSVSSPCYYPTHIPYGPEMVPSYYMADTSHLVGEGVYSNGYTTVLDKPASKPYVPASGHTHPPSKQNSEFKTNGAWNQFKGSTKPKQHGTNVQPESVKSKASLAFTKFPSYHESKGGVVYPNSAANLKANEWGSNVNESTKTRSKSNDTTDTTLLNEQNNGPKTTIVEDALCTDNTTDGKDKNLASVIQRGQFNLPDFPTKYKNAFFFVVKSYSEDDIHKSIKYSVWASTPNGNKKLDSAYQEAQEKTKENVSKCPVFLFFSVNASGQFCGVAEMTGRVDFNKSMDFWQQDKWNGYFPVKWHVIKDVSNTQLRHIILENNENKPVTNSRDTQEVRFPQGIEMLSIFKNYVSKTSILDDFDFYESRQKVMQQKRIVPSALRFDVLQPKADEWTRVENRVEVKASD